MPEKLPEGAVFGNVEQVTRYAKEERDAQVDDDLAIHDRRLRRRVEQYHKEDTEKPHIVEPRYSLFHSFEFLGYEF